MSWARTFEAVHDQLAGGVDTWRREQLARFEAAGLPAPKAPVWKNTPLRALTRHDFTPVVGGTGEVELPDLPGTVVVLVDGVVAAMRGDGVVSLSDRLASDDTRLRMDAAPSALNAPFDALNAAFVAGGTVIDVASTAVVHLVHRSTGGATSSRHVRHLVRVGRSASLVLVEHHEGGEGLHHVVTDIEVDANGSCEHVVLQQDGAEAVHLADWRVRVGRDGRYRGHAFDLGASWARTGVHVDLDTASDAHLSFLALGRDKQHLDHTVRVEHIGGHAKSEQVFRGVLTDRARRVASSLLVVGKDAGGADGLQEDRNLLLSDRAHADSEPQLEIYTDDVKASHGSAIGKLDPESLFFLRARGIDVRTARQLLTGAFARHVVEQVQDETARTLASEAVEAWLAEAIR